MRLEIISIAVLVTFTGASSAALNKDSSPVTTDAAVTDDIVNIDQGNHFLAKRAKFEGNCDVRQWDMIHDAMYACNQMARKAAAVARTNHTRLKEFFPPTSETNDQRKYTKRVANVVAAVFDRIEKECGHINPPAFPMLQVNCEKIPGRMCRGEYGNTYVSSTPDLRHRDEAHSPYGIVWICPHFLNPNFPTVDRRAELEGSGADRSMVLLSEMTQIKAIRGAREFTSPGDPDALLGLNGNDALWNAASYAYFARAVRYPEAHWHPFPGRR